MKNLYKHSISIIVAVSATMISCDDKSVDGLNTPPSISIYENQTEVKTIKDSIKISLKSSKNAETYRFNFSDLQKNINTISFEKVVGDIEVSRNSSIVSSIDYDNEASIDLTFKPKSLGTNVIRVKVIDNGLATDYVELQLIAITNEEPVAVLNVVNSPLSGVSNNYTIDASASFDRDQKIGGGIVLYEYTIDGLKVKSSESTLKQIFAPGSHSIKLRVKDLDDAYSPEIEKNINIQ
jgi:hypothetical protein